MARYIRINDIPINYRNRINYLFRTKKIKKYRDEGKYICFDEEEVDNIKNEKRGRKIK